MGPVEEAEAWGEEIQRKRRSLQKHLEDAIAVREGLIRDLLKEGVTSPTELKGKPAAQKIARSLVEIDGEIAKLGQYIVVADSASRDAQAVIRSLKRKCAGVSDEQMQKLTEQLQERTDGTGKPVMPLDVEVAVEKALKKNESRRAD